MNKILIFTRCTWTLINFRHDYIKFLQKKNLDITIACDFTYKDLHKIKKIFPNLKFKKINFLNKKKKILNELIICIQIFKLLTNSKFDYIHNFTIRPVIYSTIISKIFTNSKILNSITGLGHIFNSSNNFFFKSLLNLVFIISNHIIFQNKDDYKISTFDIIKNSIRYSIIFPTIKSSLKNLVINRKKKSNKKIIFLMYCRLIKQKGVIEFLEAAELVYKKNKNLNFEFKLIGNIDKNNPSSLSKKEVNLWRRKKIIKIINHKKNIINEIVSSDIVCLPSYGEGMPASLLEALYFGKGIITTDVNGCRELVKNNFNGYLIPPKNTFFLAEKFLNIINKPYLINYFGKNSIKLYKNNFSKNPYEIMSKIIKLL
jgi:glycosyltransferase involved in cell wall biosynthesis